MFLRIFALFFISFSLIGAGAPAPEASANNIEQDIKTLNKDVTAVNSTLINLDKRVSNSIDNNEKLIAENRDILKGINKSIKSQSENQKAILKALAQTKKNNKPDTDLFLSLESDLPAIWGNVFAVIASALITLYILRRTLAKETTTQIISLQENLIAQTQLNNKQIETQIKLNRHQVETQLTLSKAQHKEAHLLTIDEFRQKWINTFREDISVFIGSIIAVKDFHQIEDSFFHYWKRTKDTERARVSYYDNEANKIKQSEYGLFVVTKKLEIKSSDYYIKLLEIENEAKEEFEKYKNKYKEFKTLHVNVLQQQTKLLLMLNPNEDTEDVNISKQIDSLVSHITLGNKTIIPIKDANRIDTELKTLQRLVQNMLKSEWDRIQRKPKKIIKSSVSWSID